MYHHHHHYSKYNAGVWSLSIETLHTGLTPGSFIFTRVMDKLFLILFAALMSTCKYVRKINDKDRERLEDELLSNWAKNYVKEFFTPTPMSKSPIDLGRYL